MAFSKTPQTSTYQTKEVNLLNEWEQRDTTLTKDNDALNCFYELIQNKKTGDKDYFVVKRAGTTAYPYVAASSVIRGVHYWEDETKLFLAVDDDIYIVNSGTGALITTLTAAFGTSTGEVGFCEFLYDTNNVKIVATDGTTLITIDSSNTKVVNADADIPSPHLPQPVFLDGYLFLVKTDTADIYNSDLNDPLAWTPGDFITAEMSADAVVRISNLNNYIIVFGTASVEYFFDAANASGSPLQKYDTPHKFIGYTSGFAKSGNDIYFIGNSVDSGIQVYRATDLKLEPLSSPPLRRAIEEDEVSSGAVAHYAGHSFYIFSTADGTYQMDLDTKLWTRLAFKATSTFAITHAVTLSVSAGLVTLCVLSGSATMYYFNNNAYQDDGTNFTFRVITDNETFDTYRNKTCSRMLILGDRPSTSLTLSVYWSDDDFQTWSTARTIDMSLETPVLHRLGQFRRRAWKIEWAQNAHMRLKKMELDLNMGQA